MSNGHRQATDSLRLRGSVRGAMRIALLALVVAGCAEPSPPPTLGVIASASYVVAASLGIEDGLAAHPGLELDTVFLANATDEAEETLRQAASLLEHPGLVGVVGHASSSASLTTAPLYNDAGVVQLAPTASTPLYSSAGPFSFRMVPSDERQGPLLAEQMAAELGDAGPVAILYVNDEYGRGLRDVLRPALDARGMTVALELPHAELHVQPLDVEASVEFLVTSGARGLLFLGRAQVLDALLPTIRDRLGPIPVLGSDAAGPSSRGTPWSPGPEWMGVRYLDFVEISGTPELDAFAARFLEASGGTPSTSGVILAYDAARILVEGVAQGARTGEALAAWLPRTEAEARRIPGLLGGPAVFDDAGNMERLYTVRRVEMDAADSARRDAGRDAGRP